jgi:hypothetical protein
MNIRPLFLAIFFAALTPSFAFPQNQTFTNCHTPESSANYVGPDEIIVNGMVCKVVTTQPAQQAMAANNSTTTPPDARKSTSSGSGTVITNARVIELSKLGLDDDIVIAKIRSGVCQFQLGDSDLVDLKKAGVSPKVIAAMLDSGATASAPRSASKNQGMSNLAGEASVGLSEPGMYVANSSGYTKILGQIVDTKRSGSLLVSDLTLHIKSSKENVQILGAHAQTVLGSKPEFYFIPAKQESDAGVNAGDLILIRLEEKSDRRQFEIGAKGAWRASSGVALSHEIQLTRSEVKAGVYEIQPAVGLAKGEYGLYLSRGEGMAPYIYDFSVQ